MGSVCFTYIHTHTQNIVIHSNILTQRGLQMKYGHGANIHKSKRGEGEERLRRVQTRITKAQEGA